jgi:hypothetical protein
MKNLFLLLCLPKVSFATAQGENKKHCLKSSLQTFLLSVAELPYGANVGLTGDILLRLAQHLNSRLNMQLQGGIQIAKMPKAGSDYKKAVFPIEPGLSP